MTIIAYAEDTLTYGGEGLRQTLSALCGTPPSGRPLGATSGVRPGSSASLVTASSSTWTVGVHSGVLDLETSATAGPYLYAVSVAETGAMTAANATNPRIDLISLQVSDPAEGDGTASPKVAVVYTTGTAAASPAQPATPARAYAMAAINVPAAGGGAPSVTQLYKAWNDATLAYSYGSTTAGQNFTSGGTGTVTTWTLTATKNISYSGGIWTVTVPGFYRIDACLAFTPIASPAGIRQCAITVNGTQVREFITRGDSGFSLPMPVSWGQPFVAGDQIYIQGLQSQGASLSLGTLAKQNNLSIVRTGDA